MKRIAWIFITLTICLIAFSGCANIRYKGPLSCTRYDGENDGLETITEIDITEDVAEKIISILNSAQWNNETMNTVGDHYQFELRNATIVYHFKAGLLIDVTNGRNACLDFSTWARLNKLIGVTQERITLIYDSPIYSFVMSASEVPEIEIEDGVIYTIAEGVKERLGTVSKININSFNFDSYIKKYEGFDHSKLASELRKDNKTAYEVTPDVSANGIELYYIMEQKNGETLIVYGHYDDGKKENEIRFIYSVAKEDRLIKH